MNVSLQNIDKVSALLTVKLEKADYEAQVENTLKKYRKQAKVPGFRPGMVPMGMIKKMYGKGVKAEEVNKILSEQVYAYIKDHKVNILGEPLPNEDKQPTVDFDTQEDYEFVFDLALAPEFNVEAAKSDKIPYYTIEVTDDMVNAQIDMYRQRGGKYEKVDTYQEKDMLKGTVAELDENGSVKEGGLQVEEVVLMPDYMKNDEQKVLFREAKVNDVLVFNPHKAYDGHATEIASLLKINKEEVPVFTGDFSFQVNEITRFVPGDLNQDVFDQVFEKGTVTNEADFRAKVKELVAAQYVADTDYKFLIDVRDAMVAKVGKLEFADALLKRLMQLNNKDKDEKYIEENYEKNIQELTWHLIKEQLVQQAGIKVEQEDILRAAQEMTKAQFAQYGMLNIPEDILNNYSQEMLKKKENIDNLVNRSIETKLTVALKEKVTLEPQSISVEDFNKMFQA